MKCFLRARHVPCTISYYGWGDRGTCHVGIAEGGRGCGTWILSCSGPWQRGEHGSGRGESQAGRPWEKRGHRAWPQARTTLPSLTSCGAALLPRPARFPSLAEAVGGTPPAQTPPWARSSAFAWLLGRAASLAPRRGGLEGERRTEKQIRGWGLARSRPALTARAPTLCCLPASTSFSAEWVPPPQLPSLRAGRRHGVRTALSLGWGDGCCCEK